MTDGGIEATESVDRSDEPAADDAATERGGGLLGDPPDWTPAFLQSIRDAPRKRAVALVAATGVGLVVAWVHWLGLFVAGALVGLVSRTLPRAVLAAVAFGVVVLAVHVFASPVMGVGGFLSLGAPAYVAVAAALLVPAWGSLLRGVV